MCNKKIVDELFQMNKQIINTLMESLVNLIEDEEGNFFIVWLPDVNKNIFYV